MSDIKVTVENDGKTVSYSGDFVVIGTVRSDGDEKVLSVAALGVEDFRPYMKACERRNRERGRITDGKVVDE